MAKRIANHFIPFISIHTIEMVKSTRKSKASRKGSRKGSRKSSRKSSRRSSRCWSGGAQNISPASVNDNSMAGASRLNLAQGGDYETLHSNQHGGMAPVGETGMLDESLRTIARVGVLDQSLSAIQGMSDQSGGRRKKGRKGSKKSRKVRSSISHKNIMRMLARINKKSRKMRGGMASLANAQDYNAPGMLLGPGAEREAVMGMNPEWKLATDPAAFNPTMYK